MTAEKLEKRGLKGLLRDGNTSVETTRFNQNEDGVNSAVFREIEKRLGWSTREVLRNRRSLLASVTNWYHQSATMENPDRWNNELLIEVSKVKCTPSRPSRSQRRSKVETRYGSPSFTVDAGSSSSFSLDRSTGLSSNVKRVYREVGQLPSRGTGFLTLPSLGNLKVNSRLKSRPRGWSEESAKFTVEKKRFRRETSAMNSAAVRVADYRSSLRRCAYNSFGIIRRPQWLACDKLVVSN